MFTVFKNICVYDTVGFCIYICAQISATTLNYLYLCVSNALIVSYMHIPLILLD